MGGNRCNAFYKMLHLVIWRFMSHISLSAGSYTKKTELHRIVWLSKMRILYRRRERMFELLVLISIVLFVSIMYLTSGKINQKSDSKALHTNKSVQEVVNTLKQISGELKANVDKIEDDPFGKFGSSDDLAVMLSGEERGLSKDIWAVHVYVTSTPNGCDVELVALGEGVSAGYSGTYYHGRVKLSASKKRRDKIAARL